MAMVTTSQVSTLPTRHTGVSYLALVGPIHEATLDHLCRVRPCVNPAHLEPVSQRENVLRGVSPPAKSGSTDALPVRAPARRRQHTDQDEVPKREALPRMPQAAQQRVHPAQESEDRGERQANSSHQVAQPIRVRAPTGGYGLRDFEPARNHLQRLPEPPCQGRGQRHVECARPEVSMSKRRTARQPRDGRAVSSVAAGRPARRIDRPDVR